MSGNICENRLIATGSSEQIEKLAKLIHETYQTENFEENNIEGDDFVQLELFFDSSYRFPKDIFKRITDSIPNTEGLFIRVASDEPATNYLEQSIFKDSLWDFDKTIICDNEDNS